MRSWSGMDSVHRLASVVLIPDVTRKIETRLRNATPCYDGWTGLCSNIIPGVIYGCRYNTLLEIVSELLFEPMTGDRDSVVAEANPRILCDSLSLRYFYGQRAGLLPGVVMLQPKDAKRLANGRSRWTERAAWANDSEGARVILCFEGHPPASPHVHGWSDDRPSRAPTLT